MAIKNGCARRRAFLPALFLLALASPLYAQQAGSMLIDGRFVQRFAWSVDENTMHYEVIIEREENGAYSGIIHEFTAASLIEVSLPSGNYRYRIIPYDYLNRPGTGTQWVYIEIFPALRPEVDDVSHEVMRLDEGDEYILTISGRNIEPDAVIQLHNADGASVDPYLKEVSDDGAYVSLFFAGDQLAPGDYEIYIRNPGGHETRGATVTIVHPDAAAAQGAQDEREARRLNSLGVSIGTTFAAPLFIATVHGTWSPRQNLFLEAGLDLGMKSIDSDIDYFSLYPFARICMFQPLTQKLGWYAGGGAGFMLARYSFLEGDISVNTFTIDVVAGINLFNCIDVSYSLRTGFSGVNHKVSAGYVYRFRNKE